MKIQHSSNSIFIYLYIPEINLILGNEQGNLEKIKEKIGSLINNKKKINLNLVEIKNVYGCAQTIANLVASQIKKRVPFRLVLRDLSSKLSFERALEGAEIWISGRLGGTDIARTESISYRKMPLSTIDSNIEVGRQEVVTAYGKIGVKVLAYKGKIWQEKKSLRPRREVRVRGGWSSPRTGR